MSVNTLRRAAWTALAVVLITPWAEASAEESTEAPKDRLVSITPDMPRHNGFYHVDFPQTIQPGERLHVAVQPVRGVEVKTQVVVLLPERGRKRDKLFEQSRVGLSQDWTMRKKPPGDAVIVRVKASALATLRVLVETVSD